MIYNVLLGSDVSHEEHCIKYVRIRVFNDAYTPVEGQNHRYGRYTREYW